MHLDTSGLERAGQGLYGVFHTPVLSSQPVIEAGHLGLALWPFDPILWLLCFVNLLRWGMAVPGIGWGSGTFEGFAPSLRGSQLAWVGIQQGCTASWIQSWCPDAPAHVAWIKPAVSWEDTGECLARVTGNPYLA